jgi:alpha-tubulin suppressor-like RCC1 family protein
MDRWSPVLVSIGFATVSAGIDHTCGVTTGGDTYCWGGNEYGQLGDGSTTNRHDPVAVSGALNFATLSAAVGGHTCGVTTSWRTYCWGRNQYGQVGDGTMLERHEPVRVKSP